MSARLLSWRRPILAVGSVAGILFLAAVLDTIVGGHIAGKTTFRVVPGSRVPISGNLILPVRHSEEVRFHFDRPGPILTVAEVKGRFWRGELDVPVGTAEGVYGLYAAGAASPGPATTEAPVCRVIVYPNAAAMRAAAPSIIRRVTGIAPWWLAIGAAPLLLVCLGLSFLIAGQREAMLNRQGMLPIVKLARRKGHWEVAIPLPVDPTVASGSDLTVVSRTLQPVARMTVTGTDNGLLAGRIDLDAKVAPDGYVQLPPTAAQRGGEPATDTAADDPTAPVD